MRIELIRASFVAAAALVACGPQPAPPVAETPAPAAEAAPVGTDAWLGDWIGVEGNTLKIEKGAVAGEYVISERTLDGPLSYSGKAAEGETIVFTDTDQRTRSIRAGTGEETGLKYLAGKTNCLWIETGRGFCRD